MRRIEIKGNVKTQIKYIRRELGKWKVVGIQVILIKLSKRRIQRLAYVENVSIQERKVSNKKNMMDVIINLKKKCQETLILELDLVAQEQVYN